MKKYIVVLLVLILSLSACQQAEKKVEDATKKVEEKASEAKDKLAEKTEDAKEKVDQAKDAVDEVMAKFTKDEIAKSEKTHELKDFPFASVAFTSDKDQILVLSDKDTKKEAIKVKLVAGEKTPVFIDENTAKLELQTPDGGEDKATIKVEKYESTKDNTLYTGLLRVGFSNDIKPGTYAFQAKDKDAKITVYSKYGNVIPQEFKEGEKGIRSEQMMLNAGDRVLVESKDATLVDTVQEGIEKLEKDAAAKEKK